MKIIKKVSVSGEFAKVGKDIVDGDVVEILDSGTIISGEWGDRHAFKIGTSNGERILSFNQTSLNNLIDAFGDNSEEWIGSKVKVFVIKQMIDNKLKNVAYLTGEDWMMTDDGKFLPPTHEQKETANQGETEQEEIKPEDIPF